MDLPEFIKAFPTVDLPLPETIVSGNALQGGDGLAIFFTAHQDVSLPPHSHGAQWGTVLRGSLTLNMDDETRTYLPGESYSIPAGTTHAVDVSAGSIVLDFFEEADRYPLKS